MLILNFFFNSLNFYDASQELLYTKWIFKHTYNKSYLHTHLFTILFLSVMKIFFSRLNLANFFGPVCLFIFNCLLFVILKLVCMCVVCILVYMCVHGVWAREQVHVCACAYGGRKLKPGAFFCHFSLYVLRQDLSPN